MDLCRLSNSAEKQTPPVAEDVYGQAALADWRRRAVDVFSITAVVLYLPSFVLWLIGLGPPRTLPVVMLVFPAYGLTIAAAVFRRVDSPYRVWAILCPGYLLALIGPLVVPPGPYLRILPVVLPILALVLVGIRSGRVAAFLSIPVILLVPLVRAVPDLARVFPIPPQSPSVSAPLLLTQAFSLIAMVVGQVFLLERFHLFLIRALTAQRHATDEMEREAAQRAEAHEVLAREMAERQRLEQEITRIGDEERRRLGNDIHDGVCQELTGALLHCQVLGRRLEKTEILRPDDLNTLSSLLEKAIDEAHAVAKGLCPLEPDPEALARALRSLTKRTQESSSIHCEFVTAGDICVNNTTKAQELFRIAQEALSNAARHSQATRIVVELGGQDGELVLRVRDNGIGLSREIPTGRMGLRTMAYRAQTIGGELMVEPVAEGGTQLTCRVPADGPALPQNPRRTIEEILQ